ncbi:SMP-30/gluconolactonase/LRE family protein [Curtobacterium sp. MCBD17_026]|uniref:SMP-30/gluconolactonase/LRE family protein n=1 Tax=Curtobacterium sp. MCBD17_026 TaxID=2175621 RepID=UPI000DAA1CB2|nr:SMP-30/gluconolactonase/LRE family protein [Curtobacterium sp. MCBD17_026]WIB71195.1 SMP-30/gluconolactonase/LRE family protein [Curtobacterium sp. MCBD17_026]
MRKLHTSASTRRERAAQSGRVRIGAVLTMSAAAAVVLSGCAAPADDAAPAAARTDDQTARRVVQVAPAPEPGSGYGPLLEGPTFAADGRLIAVDVTAGTTRPKVVRIDLNRRKVTAFGDGAGLTAPTSAQFNPRDGRLTVTDFATGKVVSLDGRGGGLRVEFEGPVDGRRMQPDDLTFDPDGNMFVSDAAGNAASTEDPVGRVVRIDAATHHATVVVDALASANGIAFDEDHRGLWVSEYNRNQIDYVALDSEREEATAVHPAIRPDAGASRVDSIAVDAAGNVYQGYEGKPVIDVFSRDGASIARVSVPRSDGGKVTSATNLAIRPGTTQAYMTVSGPGGSFVYGFRAYGKGTPQSNGG